MTIDDDSFEYHAYFYGECTCEHEPEDHSWGGCEEVGTETEGCPCEAGWEE